MIRAKVGAGVWDMLFCEECSHHWTASDVDLEWTDEPEHGQLRCPTCNSERVVREERG